MGNIIWFFVQVCRGDTATISKEVSTVILGRLPQSTTLFQSIFCYIWSDITIEKRG